MGTSLSSQRISKDLKFTALYWALGFDSEDNDVFRKKYDSGLEISIDAVNGIADLGGITIVGGDSLSLKDAKSFVVLECLDRLLTLGYPNSSIIVDLNNDYDIFCKNIYIKCIDWDREFDSNELYKSESDKFFSVLYKSRLYSGIIEYENVISFNGKHYDKGIFERKYFNSELALSNDSAVSSDDRFKIIGNKVVAYNGHEKKVVLPEGVTAIESGLFWDNQEIEEVIFPDSLVNYGGDTFYNCRNLRKANIPMNVRQLGNNPFAGCPNLHIENHSDYFELIDDVLFDKRGTLIYYPIWKKDESYSIPKGTQIIGKHSFYLCDNLKEVILPSSVRHLENNPFSGCSKLNLISNTERYKVIDKVIYNGKMTEVIGALRSIKTDRLEIKEGVKVINRNSFWSCTGIKSIVFPASLQKIGYNPFVGCKDIEFISKSKNYVVENGILFSKDRRTLICCTSHIAVGNFVVPEFVNTLERGAFSGCDRMTSIDLKNVSKIGKSCFTNCTALEKVVVSDFVTYIGEWAFAHCSNLKEVSVFKDTFIDRNVFLNTNAKVIIRNNRSNMAFESDNIHVLRAMQDSLKGKIDSILIDPPYNSNIGYIGYNDSSFADGYREFMAERLALSYPLLSDKGWMVINIDKGGLKDILSVARKQFGYFNVSVRRWKKKHWFFDKNRVVLNPNKKQTDYEYIVFCRKSKECSLNEIDQPYIKDGKLFSRMAKVLHTFDCFGTTSSAKDEIAEIFGDRKAFSTPKPVKLIKEFARATTDMDSIVMDFFGGSGTTAQAVDELNKEDDGNRTFIIVSNKESDIFLKITKKRIEKIGCKVLFF